MDYEEFYAIFSEGLITRTMNPTTKTSISNDIREAYDTCGIPDMAPKYVQELKAVYMIGRISGVDERLHGLEKTASA